ncbi:MAG: M16 family metallopeptidase [bacterium]
MEDRRSEVYRESLGNGIRVVMEEIPYVRSASIGVWVGTGAKHEPARMNGISHFIEHMLFKGTKSRSAREIAEAIDNVGGHLNAFTAKEYTCFYSVILDEHIDLAIDILSDIFKNSIFKVEEMEKEKRVILEEIKMYEDTPDEVIHDRFAQTIWRGNPLGQPILGTGETVRRLNRDEVVDFVGHNYTAGNTVIALAGNFKRREVMKLLEDRFGDLGRGTAPADPPIPVVESNINVDYKDLSQIHFCLGTEGVSRTSEDRHALYVLNSILGGNMSSRLFQEVRERQALVYSIYTFHDSYKETGLFAIYAGTSAENFTKVKDAILQQFSKIREEGIDEDELYKAKEHLKGGFVLSLEETSHRMSRLAKLELYFGEIFTIDEILRRIDGVTRDDVVELARRIFTDEKLSLAAIGNLKLEEDFALKIP